MTRNAPPRYEEISENSGYRPAHSHSRRADYSPPRRQREVLPEYFDSSKDDWIDYISRYERVARWNGWTSSQSAQRLTLSLRGTASRALKELSEYELDSFEALKEALSRRFSPEQRQLAGRTEFNSRTRKATERATDYAAELSHLATKGWPGESAATRKAMVLQQFLAGVGGRELRRHVTYGRATTLEDAVALAEEFDAFEGPSNQLRNRKPAETAAISMREEEDFVVAVHAPKKASVETGESEMAALRKQVEALTKMIQEQNTRRKAPYRGQNREGQPRSTACYRCNQEGHYARECPNPPAQPQPGPSSSTGRGAPITSVTSEN
jgi:hypothetical protein